MEVRRRMTAQSCYSARQPPKLMPSQLGQKLEAAPGAQMANSGVWWHSARIFCEARRIEYSKGFEARLATRLLAPRR